MTQWDVTNEWDFDKVKDDADRAYSAIRITTGQKYGNLYTESDLVDAVRTATNSATAQVVEDNMVVLRVLFKNWQTQR